MHDVFWGPMAYAIVAFLFGRALGERGELGIVQYLFAGVIPLATVVLTIVAKRNRLLVFLTGAAMLAGVLLGQRQFARAWENCLTEGVALRAKIVQPDAGAHYDGGVHPIDLAKIQPMVATPGDPDRGIASDPKNGALIPEIGHQKIDIAYGGSCTAGKRDDIDMYARVMAEAEKAGKRVADGVEFYLQFGSQDVEAYAKAKGYLELFQRTGVKVIKPGCGACIGCGPGVSERGDQVTVSAINRNYKGRSGPGRLYLASPLTVAASAVAGEIVEYDGKFEK
jgi:homoaconitase/3-isopropylmalate dehydratase large subunit